MVPVPDKSFSPPLLSFPSGSVIHSLLRSLRPRRSKGKRGGQRNRCATSPLPPLLFKVPILPVCSQEKEGTRPKWSENVADSNFSQNALCGSNFSQIGPGTTKLRLLSNSILKARSLWLELYMLVSTSGKKVDTFSGESKYGVISFWKFLILVTYSSKKCPL